MNIKQIGIILLGLLVLTATLLYVVDQRERALVIRLGDIKQSDIAPGLHFKWPYPIEQVVKFDGRILTLDAQPEPFLTSEKKNVTVDFFVKWRIADTKHFYLKNPGGERDALIKLSQIVKDRMRSEFGKRTIQEVVSGERAQMMEIIQNEADQAARDLGVSVVDVRISRIDLPDEVSDSVYARMRAERERVARDFRARGKEAAERIRAEADREREVILAKAYGEAQRIRGDGDAKAAKIYADAYGQDPEFFSFVRSLQGYRKAFGGGSGMFVIEPDSEFFRYFKDAQGRGQ